MSDKMPFVTRARDLRPWSIRRLARHVTLSSLAAYYRLTGQTSQALAKPRVQLVHLHHVFADEIVGFHRLLEGLSDHHQLISYSEAVNRILQGPIDAPYVALSFDDGLKGCLKGAEILSDRGIRACFFVCTGMVGETNPAKVGSFCHNRLHMAPAEFMNWSDLEKLSKDGHEIGSHTVTHRRLSELSESEIQEELSKSREMLMSKLGQANHFAWPYGTAGDFSPHAGRLAKEAGYISCASGVRGHYAKIISLNDATPLLHRDQIVAYWPYAHIEYFLAQSRAA